MGGQGGKRGKDLFPHLLRIDNHSIFFFNHDHHLQHVNGVNPQLAATSWASGSISSGLTSLRLRISINFSLSSSISLSINIVTYKSGIMLTRIFHKRSAAGKRRLNSSLLFRCHFLVSVHTWSFCPDLRHAQKYTRNISYMPALFSQSLISNKNPYLWTDTF